MKLMARKRLIVTILIMALIAFFAAPLTVFAGTQIHVYIETDSAVTITEITGKLADVDEVLSFDKKGGHWTSSDLGNDVTATLEWLEFEYTVNDQSMTVTYNYPDDFGPGKAIEAGQEGAGTGTIKFTLKSVPMPEPDPEPELSIEKKVKLADTDSSYGDKLTVADMAATVEYQFVVTNTGNVDLEDVGVYDQTLNWTSDTVALPSGGSHTFTTTYTISAENWNDSKFINVASAGGIYSDNAVTSDTDTATVIYDEGFSPDPELSIEKKVKLADSESSYVEELTVTDSAVKVEYQFEVTNTGNVDLEDVYVYDQILGWTSGKVALPVGERYAFTTTHDISDDAWGEGMNFVNTASAAGIYNKEAVKTGTNDAAVKYEEIPNLSLIKGVRLAGSSAEFGPSLIVTSPSTIVEYQFAVENTGNVGLDVSVFDEKLSWTSETAYITPGSIYNFVTTPVAITADDWDSESSFSNTATAGAFYNDEPVISAPGSAVVYYNDQTQEKPNITLKKAVSPTSVDSRTATVTYTFTITNTGDFDLYNVRLSDPLIGVSSELGDLAVGAHITTTSSFQLKTDLWDGKSFINTAEVKGFYGEVEFVTASAIATVTYDGGGGGGGEDRERPDPKPPVVIDDEPIPEAPVILDEAVPAGPLPKTGGVPSLLLYGLGALLAGGGAALKQRSKKSQ